VWLFSSTRLICSLIAFLPIHTSVPMRPLPTGIPSSLRDAGSV
jgi:hypothetical protein